MECGTRGARSKCLHGYIVLEESNSSKGKRGAEQPANSATEGSQQRQPKTSLHPKTLARSERDSVNMQVWLTSLEELLELPCVRVGHHFDWCSSQCLTSDRHHGIEHIGISRGAATTRSGQTVQKSMR